MRVRSLLLGMASVIALAAAPVAAATQPTPVTINVSLALSGNLQASTTVGTFSITGGLTAAGTESGTGWFAGQGHLRTGEPNSLHSTLLLTAADGTITLQVVGLFGQLPAPLATGEGRWVIADGTGAYASLHGQGIWTAVADFRNAIAQVGPPRVTFTMSGTVN